MAKGKYHDWLMPEGLLKLEGWARDGLTDEQIAQNMGITAKTLYEWKNRYGEICEALKKGKEVVDRQVENALLKRALGYRYTEVTKERIVDGGQKKRHGGESELTEQDWEIAKAYFGYRCCYCGCKSELTKDHFQPLSHRGRMTAANIVPACQSCNSSKKDKEWLSWYQSQPFYDKVRAQKIADYITFVSSIDHSAYEGEMVTTKVITKEVAPDTTAQIFWLKNRKPEVWRDKQDLEHSGGVNIRSRYESMSEEELQELINRYEKINRSD